jgi:hypothetical protein
MRGLCVLSHAAKCGEQADHKDHTSGPGAKKQMDLLSENFKEKGQQEEEAYQIVMEYGAKEKALLSKMQF